MTSRWWPRCWSWRPDAWPGRSPTAACSTGEEWDSPTTSTCQGQSYLNLIKTITIKVNCKSMACPVFFYLNKFLFQTSSTYRLIFIRFSYLTLSRFEWGCLLKIIRFWRLTRYNCFSFQTLSRFEVVVHRRRCRRGHARHHLQVHGHPAVRKEEKLKKTKTQKL